MLRAGICLSLVCAASGLRKHRGRSAACGIKGVSGLGNETGINIVNGDDADRCEWSWQVGITTAGYTMPWCGGMLIAPDWVLTAAHCSFESNVQIIAGDWKPKQESGSEQRIMVKEVFRHPSYNQRTLSADFALFKLESPVDLNGCVGTVCLPRDGDVPPGATCWITGWGTLSSGGRQPDILQEGAVSIISNQDCKYNFGYRAREIDDYMLCAQGRSQGGDVIDGCQGDSGGPLVCETAGTWSIYGATSWGYGCASPSYPGVWARVHYVLDWIDAVMG